jgi:alanyl-tRNA synthetase
VIARFVSKAALDEMPLRKMPVVDGPIRIVQVDEFDWSPCGGTHVVNTGQVGLVKVTRVERRKKQSRVHFLCGRRALSDYSQKQGIVRDLVAHLTTSEDELLSSVQRLEAEIKCLRKALSEAQMQLLEQELAGWAAQAESIGELRVVRLAFEDRDPVLLREAARRLTEEADVVALLATSLPRPQFVFARPEDVTADMGALMRAACAAVGGRGGGRPQFAQGGAPEGASATHALEAAVELLRMS